MKINNLHIIFLVLITTRLGFGQIPTKQSFFGIRGGYQRVSTEMSINTLVNAYTLNGYAPRNTFYGGIFYQQTLTRWFTYRAEVNYQQKGYEHRDQYGDLSFQDRLHYVGFTPLVGITPLKNLSFLVGPEANWLIKNSYTSPATDTKSVEFGLTGRVSYRYKWIGAEVGYFKAVNEYSSFDLPEASYKSRSRSWQVGLFLVPSELMDKNRK